ncbi:MAG TPA: hypothetical protein VH393_17130 [Ktedonobacterales bacterium]
MAKQHEPFEQIEHYLEELDVTLTLVRVESGVYVVIPPMCEELGVGPQAQVDKLKKDRRMVEHLERVPYDTKTRGVHLTWGLRRYKFGDWVRDIDPQFLRSDLVGKVDDLDKATTMFTDQWTFGGLAHHLDPAPPPSLGSASVSRVSARISSNTQVIRGEIHFNCTVCGAAQCLVLSPDGNHVVVGQEIE